MAEYPSNSVRRSSARKDEPQEEKQHKLERVVESEVIKRKKPLGTRFKEALLGGSDRSILEFVVQDVFIPGIRDMLFEGQQRAAEQFFYGESAPARRGVRLGDPRRTNYNGMASSRRMAPEPRGTMSHRARAQHDFGEIIIGTRPEAEAVLEQMFAALETYDMVSVSDLYELVGQSSQFTDRNWGWTDLRGSDIRRIREGYLLILPPTESLSR